MTLLHRFRENILTFAQTTCQKGSSYVSQVTQGQKAKVLVIGCCDSLVDPNILMGAELGELFVHRNIAALVPPYEDDDFGHYHGTSAVLEFAVRSLKVDHIIVLGHGYCGGMRALLEGKLAYESNFLERWLSMASEIRDVLITQTVSESLQRRLEQESVKLSLQHLKTFPWIQEALEQKTLSLHGWHFDRGRFAEYSDEMDSFSELSRGFNDVI